VPRTGIAGAGCALLDILHPDARFDGEQFNRFSSRSPGDGGLVPGRLVFADALERFCGLPAQEVVNTICGNHEPTRNLGGPAIVALVLAAQVLAPEGIPVRYFGSRGADRYGEETERIAGRTPLGLEHYRSRPGPSPVTRVLSDPNALDGAGERLFISTLGVAEHYHVRDIPDEFYDHEIVFFGGTALVPRLHEELGTALQAARTRGALTVVGTVYDFINESRAPGALWPLGEGQGAYPLVDLIVTDSEEARRLTGADTPADAVRRFIEWGAGAAVVTCGARPVWFAASGGRFSRVEPTSLPVSAEVRRLAGTVGASARDTTGCGDNFAGGALISLAHQLRRGAASFDITDAVALGISAGAAAWFQLGGTFIETRPGEAGARLRTFSAAYSEQIRTQEV